MRRLALLAALAGAAGCTLQTLSDLDELEQELWVHVTGRPANFDPFEYGLGVASPGQGPGLRFGVVGQVGVIGMNLVAYDASGKLESSRGVSFPNAAVPDLDVVLPIAGDPGAPRLAFGYNEGGPRYAVLDAASGDLIGDFELTGTVGGAFPSGLAIGDVDGLGTSLVAAVATDLFVVADYAAPATTPEPLCSLGGPAAAVLVAAGKVMVAHDAADPPDSDCDGSLVVRFAVPGVAAMAAGEDYVALGRPRDRAVSLFESHDPAAPLSPLTGPAGAERFGASLAVGRLGGGSEQLVVGDDGAAVSGRARAGSVHIYTGTPAGAPALTLHDADPREEQGYGRSVTVATFEGATPLLVVAGKDEVYTYFRLRPSDPDPRR